MVIVLNVYLVHPCQDLHLGSRFLQSREGLLSTLLLTSLCSCLCLFDTFIELHAMDEKTSNTLPLESESEFHI